MTGDVVHADASGRLAAVARRLVEAGLAVPSRIQRRPADEDRPTMRGATVPVSRVSPLGIHDGQAPQLYVVDRLWWGDYVGDAVSRSNYRSLLRDHPGEFIYLTDVLGSHGLALPADFHNGDLAEAIAALADCALYDEQDHSQLVTELAADAWSWLRHDIAALLSDIHQLDPARVTVGEDELRALFYRLRGEHFGDEYAESATSVVFPSLPRTVALMADQLRQPGQPA